MLQQAVETVSTKEPSASRGDIGRTHTCTSTPLGWLLSDWLKNKVVLDLNRSQTAGVNECQLLDSFSVRDVT
jgi:hypothetical protein